MVSSFINVVFDGLWLSLVSKKKGSMHLLDHIVKNDVNTLGFLERCS